MTADIRCPTCASLGTATTKPGMYICDGPFPHPFWAATRRCECGSVPVAPAEGDVWVCLGCERWEPVR